jgi:hypothetical protein
MANADPPGSPADCKSYSVAPSAGWAQRHYGREESAPGVLTRCILRGAEARPRALAR